MLAVLCWTFAGMLMVPMLSTSTASAARLEVSAGATVVQPTDHNGR